MLYVSWSNYIGSGDKTSCIPFGLWVGKSQSAHLHYSVLYCQEIFVCSKNEANKKEYVRKSTGTQGKCNGCSVCI